MAGPRISRIRLDSRAIDKLMTSDSGPAMRHAWTKGDEVKAGARKRVGVSKPAARSTRSGGSQHLRDSITKRMVKDRRGPAVYVGSDLDHARLHHEGTNAHVIRPVRAKMLRFTVGGRVVFAMKVNHPGTRPNPYLVDAAKAAGLRVRRLVR